jgi:uncharacterized lipoprotein YddW (UPF0748 family)
MKMRLIHYIFTSAVLLLLASCGSSGGDKGSFDFYHNNDSSTTKKDSTTTSSAKPRFIWIDAGANFYRFADSKENIRTDLTKAKNAGFTDVVVDVRPTMGDVLYQTTYVDQVKQLDYWPDGGGYKYYVRSATWDYLQAFIDIGHELGLKVDAAFNTFVGGDLNPYGLGSQGMLFRDSSKRSWATVLNLSSGLTNVMDLTSTDPSNANYHGTKFLNPANDEVQTFILNLLGDLSKYNLDGIFLDRCRYEGMEGDFSDETKKKFESYLGKSFSWPNDELLPGTTSLPSTQPAHLKAWLAFRAKVIHDFIAKAAERVHSVNSKIRFGVYVGAWYSTYYENGVNWASPRYKTATYYPKWANSDYADYGFANLLDFMLVGAYSSVDNVYGTTEWTMEGFCEQAKRLLCGDVKFAGGPDVGNSTGFENGGQDKAVTNSVDACIKPADGYFVFDMVHVRKFNYWNALKTGIDKYLESLKQ